MLVTPLPLACGSLRRAARDHPCPAQRRTCLRCTCCKVSAGSPLLHRRPYKEAYATGQHNYVPVPVHLLERRAVQSDNMSGPVDSVVLRSFQKYDGMRFPFQVLASNDIPLRVPTSTCDSRAQTETSCYTTSALALQVHLNFKLSLFAVKQHAQKDSECG